jgi:hypothetical protein
MPDELRQLKIKPAVALTVQKKSLKYAFEYLVNFNAVLLSYLSLYFRFTLLFFLKFCAHFLHFLNTLYVIIAEPIYKHD